jgi:hypothetical protein
MQGCIFYRNLKGYKYELAKDYCHPTGIKGHEFSTEYLALDKTGLLYIKKRYAWDGASGPTVDTKSSLRGSLVHDAIYQLIRLKHLPLICKEVADLLLKEICIEDGMNTIRASVWYHMVSDFGGPSCIPGSDNKQQDEVCTAP